MTPVPTPNEPIMCAVCGQMLLAHFAPNGAWMGCYDLPDTEVVVTPTNIKYMFQMTGEAHGIAVKRAREVAAGPRPRVKYALKKNVKGQEKLAKELTGQTKALYQHLSTVVDGVTVPAICESLHMKPTSVEFALWKLKKAGLLESLPL